MTFFGYFVLGINLFSLYIGYRIFDKVLKKKSSVKGEGNFFEKGLVLFFICLLMISINSLTMILSYTFFWEKAYRSISENKYEAVVIGYKKESVKTQNFRNSTYDNKFAYFPKVKYINSDGNEIIKTVDLTSNHPPSIGQKLPITDKNTRGSANTIDINGMMFIIGGVFTGIAAFFASLISTYVTQYTFRKRIALSLYAALIIGILNGTCTLIMYFRQ
ncbi:hypothetical protein CLU96_3956 [Chryseobacterium sp. 52]|uniref:hypothetical protein n=1 Tax=Chryseobacterium sp. 52 TaxID=2035213 RepID=UPI000C199FE1|nr:hypothetical protein [Chryseobacterium sp. 52]PIF46910.1 hypothetical protein CLU96_3956 [Chryseobacterium sp. 52]